MNDRFRDASYSWLRQGATWRSLRGGRRNLVLVPIHFGLRSSHHKVCHYSEDSRLVRAICRPTGAWPNREGVRSHNARHRLAYRKIHVCSFHWCRSRSGRPRRSASTPRPIFLYRVRLPCQWSSSHWTASQPRPVDKQVLSVRPLASPSMEVSRVPFRRFRGGTKDSDEEPSPLHHSWDDSPVSVRRDGRCRFIDWPCRDSRTLWQLGTTTREGLPGRAVSEMSREDFVRSARAADVVVTHAGIGTLLDLLDMGIYPVSYPPGAQIEPSM